MALVRRSLLVLLVSAAAAAHAGEPPPAPAGIDAAKRDFDAVKNARSNAVAPRSDVPAVSTPELHLSGDDFSAFRESQRTESDRAKNLKDRKSRGWLVDAMEEKKPDSRSHARKGDRATTDERDDATDSNTATDPANLLTAPAEKNERESPRTPAAATDNPLNNYMAGWMTPKDYDLLKVRPETDAGAIAGPARVGESAATAPGVESLLRPSSSGPGAERAPFMLPDSKSNPYLADLLPSPGGGPAEALRLPPPPPAPTRVESFAPLPKNDLPPPKSAVSPADLLKPSNDAKYFPQLKRF